ncbi:hypothetical protein C8R46DRAFT_1213442 [Mycena filopes]|nr:hypothetical protein C8R46DRAFT_1213442 [Mycena filopes]
MPTTSPEDPVHSQSSTSLLLRLPQELILAIYEYLAEPELVNLYAVASAAKELAILTFVTRYGISEALLQSGSLHISCSARRAFGYSRPVVQGPTIRFDDREHVDHLPLWRTIVHFAMHAPVIPSIDFTFPANNPDIVKSFSTAVPSLMGATAFKPVLIINYSGSACVRPQGPHSTIDRGKLARTIQLSISTAAKQTQLSTIHIRAFPQATASVGCVVVVNPSAISFLDVDAAMVSTSEWEFVLPRLKLPTLRRTRIHVDLECSALSSFFANHAGIEHLDFRADWSELFTESWHRFPSLPALKYLAGSARVINLALQRPAVQKNQFPLLKCVCINFTPQVDDTADFPLALHRIAACSSVGCLALRISAFSELPWTSNLALADRPERALRNIRKVQISPWTHDSESAQFSEWLRMFPKLKKLEVSGDLFPTHNGSLVSAWLMQLIKTECPHVVVTQERRFV